MVMYLMRKHTPGPRHNRADSGSSSRHLGRPHVPANSFTTPATMCTANTTQLKTSALPHKKATSAQDVATAPHPCGPLQHAARTVSVLGALKTCDAHTQQHAR